jgi:phosphoribosylformimino-5-aminoimidazole carboxamide ribotide isomerase
VDAELLTGFTVFPAIDLQGGRCVRLVQGDFGRSTEYDADPVERAREWDRRGARALHVVDLDGAVEGRPMQLELVREIAHSVRIPVQAGGGIRTLEDLRSVREVGARRILVGTTAVENRDLRIRAVEELGADLVVAVDARDGVVATHGWRLSSGIGVLDLAEELAADGVATVLYTDVSRDGTSSGVALEETAAVASLVPTIAGGGVRGMADVLALSKIDGVVGVVVGRALYEGLVTLEQLIEASESP